MWACFKGCVQEVLPGAGWVTIALIVGGVIALAATGIGLTLGAIAAVVGTALGSTAIGTLLGCLLKCI